MKPRSAFHRNRAQPDGITNFCKPCAKAHVRKWRRGPGARRYRQRVYGLSHDEYTAMVEVQDGRCAICRQEPVRKSQYGTRYPLHVDHDHTTGQVRGLLCFSCNAGLGKFRDDPERLRAAASYLER